MRSTLTNLVPKYLITIAILLMVSPFAMAQETTKKKSFWNKLKRPTHAVIVGISDYEDPNIPDLQFAHRDAEAFQQYLMSPAGGSVSPDNVTLLINDQATGGNVHKAMYALLKKVQKRDKCIIYFSGHGDVETIFQDEPGHLLLYDTPAEIYQINSLRVNDLKRIVTTLSTKNGAEVYLYTDACRSGNLAGSEVNGAQATAASLNTQFSNEVKLMSCQANEYSVEGTQWGDGRGVFSYHLIEGLTGLADTDKNQTVSLQELERYLEDEIANDLDNHKQSPVVIGDKGTKIAFVHEESLRKLQSDKGVLIEETEEELLALKGTEIDSSNLQELFYEALTAGRLMALDSTSVEGTAAQYFDLIINDEKYAAKAPILKGDLISALQDGAQKEINLYLQADAEQTQRRWANDYKSFEVHAQYLNKAVSLLDEFHYLYPQLKAKAIYFETAAKRMQLRAEKADPEAFVSLEPNIQMALSMQPRSPYLYNELGLIYEDQKKYELAIEAFKSALEMSPTWVWPYNNLYEVHYHGNADYSEAIDIALKGLKIDSSFSAFNRKISFAYFQLNKLDSAIHYEEKFVKSEPDRCFALNDLAFMYKKNGQIDLSKQVYYQSINCDSSFNLPYEGLTWMYIEDSDYKSAINLIKRALNSGVSSSKLFELQGLVFEAQGVIDSAKTNYLKAIEIKPSNPIRYNLVRILITEENYENAERILQDYSFNINSEDEICFFTLALIAKLQRNNEKSINYLDQAKSLDLEKGTIEKDPYFDFLRNEEVFIELYEQLPE